MRVPGFPRFGPAIVMLAAAASATFLFLHAPPVRAECGGTASGATPCPPSPTPIPVNAFLSLDVTNGPANTVVNVTGGQFLPNEQVTLYWDQPDKVAGGATADASGSFNTRAKPFSADAPGVHKLCASVPPNPRAHFALESAQPPHAATARAEYPPASGPQLPAAEWGPPTEWGTGVPDGGYPELSTPEEPDD